MSPLLRDETPGGVAGEHPSIKTPGEKRTMTYRERRMNRVARLAQWADKREVKSDAASRAAHELADRMPFGQPILVGHHSEARTRRHYARVRDLDAKSREHGSAAADFRGSAATIQEQAERSIYSDDPDAPDRLRERIAALEAERDRIKAYNASARRGKPDLSLLDESQRYSLEITARVAAYQIGDKGTFPAYSLANLSGNIKRQRDRLAKLERVASGALNAWGLPRDERPMDARFESKCSVCRDWIEKGAPIAYSRIYAYARHIDCIDPIPA